MCRTFWRPYFPTPHVTNTGAQPTPVRNCGWIMGGGWANLELGLRASSSLIVTITPPRFHDDPGPAHGLYLR